MPTNAFSIKPLKAIFLAGESMTPDFLVLAPFFGGHGDSRQGPKIGQRGPRPLKMSQPSSAGRRFSRAWFVPLLAKPEPQERQLPGHSFGFWCHSLGMPAGLVVGCPRAGRYLFSNPNLRFFFCMNSTLGLHLGIDFKTGTCPDKKPQCYLNLSRGSFPRAWSSEGRENRSPKD